MTAAIIIPFRDRGVDPARAANLKRVLAHWEDFPAQLVVVSDGRDGDAQFCRSAAYNRGAAATNADVLAYVESDILLDYTQLEEAIAVAGQAPGVVIPFTHQHQLSDTDSALVRAHQKDPADCIPERIHHTRYDSWNHGCANVISTTTLNLVGRWDEQFQGHGHDDTAMMIAFHLVTGRPARWVHGIAYHLWHLNCDPDYTSGPHITADDKAAQHRNHQRLQLYRAAKTRDDIRHLTAGGDAPQKPDPALIARWGANNWRVRSL